MTAVPTGLRAGSSCSVGTNGCGSSRLTAPSPTNSRSAASTPSSLWRGPTRGRLGRTIRRLDVPSEPDFDESNEKLSMIRGGGATSRRAWPGRLAAKGVRRVQDRNAPPPRRRQEGMSRPSALRPNMQRSKPLVRDAKKLRMAISHLISTLPASSPRGRVEGGERGGELLSRDAAADQDDARAMIVVGPLVEVDRRVDDVLDAVQDERPRAADVQ
jgi:hypothetical protein